MDGDIYPRQPHTAIIVGRTACGKTKFALDLLEGPFRNAFDQVFILCPTVRDNQTYLSRPWIRQDPNVALIDPTRGRHDLHAWIHGLSEAFRGVQVLFLLDDLAAERGIKRKHDGLSRLVFSGRHRGHSLWLLSQKWNAVSTDVRTNAQWVALFACKEQDTFCEVLRDNDVVPPSEKCRVKDMLAKRPHAKLVLRTAWPPSYQVLP